MPRKRKRSAKQSSWLCSLEESRISKALRSQFETSAAEASVERDQQSAGYSIENEHESLSNTFAERSRNEGDGNEISVMPEKGMHQVGVAKNTAVLQDRGDEEVGLDEHELGQGVCPLDGDIEEEELRRQEVDEDFPNREVHVCEEVQITPFHPYDVEDAVQEGVDDMASQLDRNGLPVVPSVPVSAELGRNAGNENISRVYNEKDVLSEVRRWENPYELLSLVMVTGSVRFPAQQYEVFRQLPLAGLDSTEEEGKLSSYNAVRRLHQRLQKIVHPKSVTAEFEVLGSGAQNKGAGNAGRDESGSEQDGEIEAGEAEADFVNKEPVRVVLPTSWARQDVATPGTYRFLFESEDADGMHVRSIEKSNIVRNRHSVTCPGNYVYVDCGIGKRQVSAESTIKVVVSGKEPPLIHGYETTRMADSFEYSSRGSKYCIEAEIAEIWYVGSHKEITASGKVALRGSIRRIQVPH